MKKTGIVVCMLAALVGLAGCSSVVTGDKADGANEKISGTESQGQFKVNTPDDEWFKETALDVAASVNELANDEAI